MNDWFRSWHGAPTDPKWLWVARKAGVAPVIVNSIVWAMLDHASQQAERGSVATFDIDSYAVWADIDEEQAHAVIAGLEAKGVIADGHFTNWEKRQPKREDDSRERVRAFRERQREQVTDVTPVTHGNAPQRTVTLDTDTEEIQTREDAVPPSRTEVGSDAVNGMTDTERRVIERLQQTRGMEPLSAVDVVQHLRDVLRDRPPMSAQQLLDESLRFRDYWNKKRANQPVEHWRGWRMAMTNWFTRVRDASAPHGRDSPGPDRRERELNALLTKGSYIRGED